MEKSDVFSFEDFMTNGVTPVKESKKEEEKVQTPGEKKAKIKKLMDKYSTKIDSAITDDQALTYCKKMAKKIKKAVKK